MLLQVFLDHVVGGFFGLTEPSDDEGKSVSQSLHVHGCFLQHHHIKTHADKPRDGEKKLLQ